MEAEAGSSVSLWMERTAREVSGRGVVPVADLINTCVLCCSEQKKA